MKTKQNPSQRSGSALLITLFMMTILAVSIAGYLTYTEQQTFLGARSQTWNMAIAVSEAGVEEGLQQLNSNTTNLTADGWTASGSVYSISRSFANGSSYNTAIDYSNPNAPIITSRAWVQPPTLLSQNAPTAFFAATGVNTTASLTNVTRAVQVTCSRSSLFLAAMVAKHQIDMNGNGITTDSFDSADPTKSTNGQWDPAKARDHGDVVSNDGVVNTLSVGNGNIYGIAYTGPGGSASIGPNGAIGSHAWQASNSGIEPGWYFNNANFTFPDTSLPYNSGLAAGPGDVLTVTGSSTNSTTYSAQSSPPGTLSAGQTVGPITTNNTSLTTNSYPGAIAGLTTNTTSQTVSNYPGNVAGLVTNSTTFTTTSTYPGAQPQMTTNITTASTTTSGYPAAGTYTGVVTTNYNGNSQNIKNYTYNKITGTTYTYASGFTYTYPTYTYTYPIKTYTYTLYTSTPTYSTNHYDHVIASGDYYATDLGGTTLVTGTARLVMPNGLGMSGNDQMTIATGGSLALYSGGTSFAIGGNGVVNLNGLAANFIVYCTPTVTSFSLSGNAQFTGVLVAPNADLRLNGGGNNRMDFSGSLMVNSVTMNGHFNFHYDEALGRMNNNGRYLITSWNEIP